MSAYKRDDPEAMRAYRAKYNASPKARAARKRYATTDAGRASLKRAKEKWQAANPTWAKEYGAKRHRDRANRIDAIKLARGCADCGYSTHAVALDFDHAGSEKIANVSALIRRHSWETIEAEIAKCEVVCANCHRVRTLNERRNA